MPSRFALLHGAATTPTVYDAVAAAILALAPDALLEVPLRPSSGDLDVELAALAAAVHGRVVGGVSGGATLGLALLAAGAPLAGAVLHEPAAGSLAPGLLDGVVAAYEQGGVAGFARALYGERWRPEHAPADPEAVARDLRMFRAFEPAEPADAPAHDGAVRDGGVSDGAVPVLLTVGAHSPPVRHQVAWALSERLGFPVRVIEGCGHAVHLEAPHAFAALLVEVSRTASYPAASGDVRDS